MKLIIYVQVLLAVFGGMLNADEHDAVDSMNIYQRIKDADTSGLSVDRHTDGQPEPVADIILDEQGEATGGRGNDAASRPLFKRLAEERLDEGTFPLFIALFDNYAVHAIEKETYSDEEQQEIDKFLDAAVLTRPMRVAYTYVTENLGQDFTEAEFREKAEQIWFELYTNHFGNNSTPFCSGFEHVFIGEGKFPADGTAPRRGEITGYHGWVKFFLDEKAQSVDYLGHKYDLPPARKPANPAVITLRMLWNYDPDGDNGSPAVELFKPKGGFFVGTSPECELAMGTVAFFEHDEGMLNDDRRRTVIDGATYDLVLYRSVKANGQRGDHIRSFYPVLVGLARPIDDPVEPSRDGPILIVRALPNPEGNDEAGEWVELKNVSDSTIDLGNWELFDRDSGTRKLEGGLDAGDTRRFEVPRDEHTLRLGNSGGVIRLSNDSQVVDEVSYTRAASGQIVEF